MSPTTETLTLPEAFERIGMSKSEFARRIAADPAQVRRWLNGTNVPGRFWRREIARALGLKVGAIEWDWHR